MSDSVAVLDYGSRWLKAGWAYNFPTEEEPRIMTPSAVHIDPDGAGDAAGSGSSSELHRPIRGGKITNWDEFESLAYYVLYELLGWELGNEGNIMLCEPLLTGRPDRETMTQLMFEVFNVTGLFCQDQAVLSLFAFGRTNGLVVDVGHDKVDVATVTEGQVNPSTVRRLEFGGANLNQYMQQLMKDPQRQQQQQQQASGDAMAVDSGDASSSAQQPQQLSEETAEALKELCVRVAESEAAFSSSISSSSAPQTFQLPDGQQFTVQAGTGLRLGEALFQPTSLLGIRGPNIAEAAVDSAACLMEPLLRKLMYENMILVGGGSVIPGISQRFISEVRAMVPANANAVLCPAPEYLPSPSVPRDAVWVGGAVLAKVALIQNHFIVKADYEEAGPAAVHRRCT
ncbi:hypothetical protein PLESTB_001166200 [Pleodorina starrii]|uniref:Actin-related protein n=1 Tax=Pleodorina starrii TaxID=330485 RepID=A0A9W6BRC1_9CHLO|nr:hypothetical protein PLESTM_000241800 [Pleodorina starrii]GLC56944.1 hypothetical protein PLESTB_001166200 [Pleodorina starrii]GLC64779.1 hypothetical protein PLESTF_000206600 [Pleodorina starrii]